MKKMICVLVCCALMISAALADTAPKFNGWKQAETEHFRFVYEEASRQAAEAYAKIADEAWTKVGEVYCLPEDKITVYVMARTNIVNAYTATVPLSIGMYTTPFISPDFTYRDDWVEYVFTHELIHAANMSFENRDNLMGDLFGKIFNALDFQNISRWAVEGLTTVLETELTDAGRGRSPYFEMLYKAPALEGALLSYDEIGLEEEPPRGQIYVYGYLMMRSIADRWGLDTLADLERNRPILGSFDDSVLAVTGEKATDLWRDVKIALTKKYASERSIPEGTAISPRDKYYYNPAVILDDGRIITLRRVGEQLDAVMLDPALESGESFYEDLKDGNPVKKETVLFTGSFQDAYALTADKNGKVYASLEIKRADRAPGAESEYQIFSWDKENDLVQLTSGSTYFQPSVSRDGSVLVALEQKDLHMRLVQIDQTTGDVTPLLDDASYDIGYPTVNEDGSKVALLRIGGGRAAVCYLDLQNKAAGTVDASALTVVANGDGAIVDPAYPSWNSNGSLTYCSNDRGRLEVYEVTENADGTFSSRPVVSDPVAALWAYETPRGVYYASYASNGNVIKMKPAEEWGVVPDWNGPSMPGEKICLGDLEEDYATFSPYENGDKKDFVKRDKAAQVNEETIKAPVTELQNEKKYVNLPVTVERLPAFKTVALPGGKNAFGFGGILMGMSSQLTGRLNMIGGELYYYPKLTNFTGEFVFYSQLNNLELEAVAFRELTTSDNVFTELNALAAGVTIPFYNKTAPTSQCRVGSFITGLGGLERKDASAIALNSSIPYNYLLSGAAGLDLHLESSSPSKAHGTIFNASAAAIANWKSTQNTVYYGAEADIDMLFGGNGTYTGFYLQGRYFDAPASMTVLNSTMKHAGKPVSCEDPINISGKIERVFKGSELANGLDINFNLYEQALCSFTADNIFYLDPVLATGLEAALNINSSQLTAGITVNYNLLSQNYAFGGFYFGAKLGLFRR